MRHEISRKGQVWIESVLYTLIALALIGVVLGIVTPKINQYRDKVVIEQSITAMQQFGQKIDEVSESSVGTRLTVPAFSIKRGELIVDPANHKITLSLNNLRTLYSEPGQEIRFGGTYVKSTRGTRLHSTEISIISEGLTFSGDQQRYPASGVPYRFMIQKIPSGAATQIKIEAL